MRFSCRPRQNHLIADGGISSGGDEVEKKEQNRLETINRWDPPDADWAAEYAWTRYRGPAPWPCPGAWVLDEPEGLAFRWLWFPEVGTEYGAVASVLDDHGGNSIDTFREAEAFLIGDDVADSVREEKIEWTLSIDGDDVFSRREPDREDLMAAVAEVLTRYPDGDWRDVTPTSGSPPPEIIRERERERRREENESLDEFATDGGRTPTDDLDQQLLEGVGRAAYLRDYVFGIKPGQSEIMWDPVYPSHRAPRECPFCGSVYRRHGGWADHRDNCEAGPNPGANPVRARGEQS